MRAKYGLTAENRPTITLDPSAVPPALRPLIPLAERFGVGDDLIRADIVAKTPDGKLAAMRAAVEAHADAFDDWPEHFFLPGDLHFGIHRRGMS
jgi:hypothetical protein